MNAETVKIITRPVLVILLVAGWILMGIFSDKGAPGIYQAVTIIMVLEWCTERGFKRFLELLEAWTNRKFKPAAGKEEP